MNATYFLCTTGAAFPKLYEMLQEFVSDLGARPTHIDAVAHDRIMAVVSHLPHVLANVLMDHAGDFQVRGKRALHWVGPSFKDLTRVAGANPPMWGDIFLENRAALADSLRAVAAELHGVLRICSSKATRARCGDVHRRRRPATARSCSSTRTSLPQTCSRSPCACPTSPACVSKVMTALGRPRSTSKTSRCTISAAASAAIWCCSSTGEDVAETAAALLEPALGYPVRG